MKHREEHTKTATKPQVLKNTHSKQKYRQGLSQDKHLNTQPIKGMLGIVKLRFNLKST